MSAPRPGLGVGLALSTLALLVLGCSVGSQGLDLSWLTWVHAASAGPDAPVAAGVVVWEIRLPRTVGAWLAGALLGLAGAVAQGLFRNPLADPYLLGSASGAALGVAALLGLSSGAYGAGLLHATAGLARLGLTGAAFLGALLAVLMTLALARGTQHTLRLLLAGVVVGVVLGAIASLLMVLAPESLLSLQTFMLGSTAYLGWSGCAVLVAGLGVCLPAAWLLGRVLDALSLGEATARSLGVALGPLRLALVAVLALATGVAVAQTGLIAFVGLAAPHLVRALHAAPHARLLPLATLMGGLLLLAADVLARALLAPQELPVGALTALLGGGYLLWLMQRGAARLGRS